MRIGIDAHILGKGKGGVETVLHNLILGLSHVDSQNEYFLYLDRRHGLQPESLPANFHLRVLAMTNPWLERLAFLPVALRRDHLDLLHVQRALPPWGCPRTLVHIHDVQHKTNPELFRGAGHSAKARVFQHSARKATAIVTVTESSRRDIVLHYGVDAAKVHVVPNGVDREVFFVEEGIERTAGLILFAGAVERNKNVHGLLRAFALLVQRDASFSSLRLVLIGGARDETCAGYAHELETLVDRLGLRQQVRFLGYTPVEVLRHHMNQAALFVFPSLAEGFGLPPLEAMACGAPVVAGRIPAIQEVCGDAALLADPTDPPAIADAMEQVLLDRCLREELTRRGRARAASFRWENVARRYATLYREIVHAGK